MTTFMDALSGKKRDLHYRPARVITNPPQMPVCQGALGEEWHRWPDASEFTPCVQCGASRLFIRALRNLNPP